MMLIYAWFLRVYIYIDIYIYAWLTSLMIYIFDLYIYIYIFELVSVSSNKIWNAIFWSSKNIKKSKQYFQKGGKKKTVAKNCRLAADILYHPCHKGHSLLPQAPGILNFEINTRKITWFQTSEKSSILSILPHVASAGSVMFNLVTVPPFSREETGRRPRLGDIPVNWFVSVPYHGNHPGYCASFIWMVRAHRPYVVNRISGNLYERMYAHLYIYIYIYICIYIYMYVQYKNNPLSPRTFAPRCSSLIISKHLDAFWSSQREMWFWSSSMAVGCGNRGFCRATAWRVDGCSLSLMKQPTGSLLVPGNSEILYKGRQTDRLKGR